MSERVNWAKRSLEIESIFNNTKPIVQSVIDKISEKHEEFLLSLLTELFGRKPDLENDKGRINLVSYPPYSDFQVSRKEVWLDGVYVGYIEENYGNPIKFEFIPKT